MSSPSRQRQDGLGDSSNSLAAAHNPLVRARFSREYQTSVADITPHMQNPLTDNYQTMPPAAPQSPFLSAMTTSAASPNARLPPPPSFVPMVPPQMISAASWQEPPMNLNSLGLRGSDNDLDSSTVRLNASGSYNNIEYEDDQDDNNNNNNNNNSRYSGNTSGYGLIGDNDNSRSRNNAFSLSTIKQKVLTAKCGRRFAIAMLVIIVTTIAFSTIFKSHNNNTIPVLPKPDNGHQDNRRPFGFKDIFRAAFSPHKTNIEWLEGGEDGEFIYWETNTGNIIVEHVETRKKRILIKGPSFTDVNGVKVPTSEPFTVSADCQYIMFTTQRLKQWRHSSTAVYAIYNLATNKSLALTVNDPSSVQIAKWSPTGHSVAFVRGNDLYVSIDLTREVRITYDGSDTIFNAVPDWVYEEEILATSHALYWSPTSDAIAYLRFDDGKVPQYLFPYYFDPVTHRDSLYPHDISLRYPKAGENNPLTSLHLFVLPTDSNNNIPSSNNSVPAIVFPTTVASDLGNDYIFTSIHWVGPTMLVKIMNRVQDLCKCVTVSVDEKKAIMTAVVRDENQRVNNAWIEINHEMLTLPPLPNLNNEYSYLDLALNGDFIHIAWFKSVRDARPIFLTSGEWEVTALKGSNLDKRIVYFISTLQGSTLRTVTQADISNSPRVASVDLTLPEGFYNAQFSSKARYYWLAYDGPHIPWQHVRKPEDSNFRLELETNKALNKTINEVVRMPIIQYTTIPSEGYQLNAMIMYPPDFDPTKRYGIFMRVYGGPNSQLVRQIFNTDIHTYITSSLGMVTVVIDGRGTGLRGKKFRSCVRKNLGNIEVTDQINAARWLGQQPWANASRIGLWGWSYGGFMACKVIERNSGLFAFAIAVAPVTDWRFYDSMYTERYMLQPKDNKNGYQTAAISAMEGFRRTKFLLVHGTGDDNVHFQQSISLVRKFQTAGVHNYRLQFYPDSDHSMNFENAYSELYELIIRFLQYAFEGKDDLSKTGLLVPRVARMDYNRT